MSSPNVVDSVFWMIRRVADDLQLDASDLDVNVNCRPAGGDGWPVW
jgi:hypothetical protein